jgi:tetratricopeptide (TPR) repeat protein
MHSWFPPRRNVSGPLFALIALFLASGLWISCSRNPVQQRDAYFQHGKKYFQENKYADAAIEFQNAVKIDPHFAQGYYYLGLTRKKTGNLQAAFQAFSKEAEIDPNQTPGQMELANLYLIGNQPAEARRIAGEILTREPRNFSALLIVAQSYLGQKNYTQALKEFDKLKAIRPGEAPIYLSIGIAQLGNGNTSEAEANFRKAIELEPRSAEGYRDLANLYQKTGRPQPAVQTLEQGLKATGNSQDLYFALADLYCRWGRVSDAKTTLATLEKGRPTVDLQSRIGDFWVAHNQLPAALAAYQAAYAKEPSLLLKKKFVNAYITQNNVAEAERWNQEILKAYPKDPEGRLFAGAIAHLRGDNPAAVKQLERSLENDRNSVFGHYYLGTALMAMGENDKAKSQFYDCLKIDPAFTYAFLRLAELSLRNRDSQAATQYAREVMQLDPALLDGYLLAADAATLGNDTARAEKALLLAGQISPGSPAVQVRQAILDALRKNYAKAEQEYQSALAQAKDPTPILAGLAQVYVAQKQTGKAVQELSSYAKGPKANSALFVLLAQLHILQEDLSAATSDCQRALQLNAKSARAYFLLGRIAELQGNDAAAVENYARAGRLYPSDSLPDLLAGDLSRTLQHWSDAQNYYRQALQASPGLARAQAGLARAMLELGEDSNVALGLAQQARASSPSDPFVADDLGWVYFKKGMPELAIPLLQLSVAKMPKDAGFRFHLGMAYSAAGKKAEARLTLLEARKLGLSEAEAQQAEQTLSALVTPAKATK